MQRKIALACMALSFVFGTVRAGAPMGGLPPWQFQMTPKQVISFTDYGPYQAFSNGDLETYAGLFHGHKENIQFFFRDGKLVRIGIYLYEGRDVKAAADKWAQAYAALSANFGAMALRGLPSGAERSADTIAAAASSAVTAGGKPQMAPLAQPPDKFVFASFRSSRIQEHTFYYVVVYYDPPHR